MPEETIAADTAASPEAAQPEIISVAEQSPTQDEPTAKSSSAEEAPVAKESSLLDAIKAVVSPEDVDPTPAPKAESKDVSGKDADAAENPDKKDTDGAATELDVEKDVPLHLQPRFRQVIAERDSLKPLANEYMLIEKFMADHDLKVDEMARAYQIAGTLKKDPMAGLKMLEDYRGEVRMALGLDLPEDLSQRVEDGMIDRESAQELASRRAQEAAMNARWQQQQEQQRRQQEVQAQQQALAAQQAMANAVTAWETDIRTSDTDYARKQPLVLDRTRVLMLSEQPATPEAALALVKRAHREITEQLKKMLPSPRAVSTQTSTGQGSGGARPVARTAAEAIRQAVESAA